MSDTPTPDHNADPATALLISQIVGHAVSIADMTVVSDIESHCHVAGRTADGTKYYDLRPLLDQREQPAEVLDMWDQALQYAYWRGLVRRVPGGGEHLVTIVRRQQ